MGYVNRVAYLLLSPARVSFSQGTRLRVSNRTGFRIADEIPCRYGTAQHSHPFLCLRLRLYIGYPDRTAIIELPEDVKTELHRFGARLSTPRSFVGSNPS